MIRSLMAFNLLSITFHKNNATGFEALVNEKKRGDNNYLRYSPQNHEDGPALATGKIEPISEIFYKPAISATSVNLYLFRPLTRTVGSPCISGPSRFILSRSTGNIPISDAFSFSERKLVRRCATTGAGNHIDRADSNGEYVPACIHGEPFSGPSTFLKGTQSSNPHNDYCQHFVDTGERPQNFIRDTGKLKFGYLFDSSWFRH